APRSRGRWRRASRSRAAPRSPSSRHRPPRSSPLLHSARILGSGGAVPTGRRETSSLLLLGDDPDEAVVVDAGTGMRRLVTDPSLLQGRTRVTVLLTPFPPDHICVVAAFGGGASLARVTCM